MKDAAKKTLAALAIIILVLAAALLFAGQKGALQPGGEEPVEPAPVTGDIEAQAGAAVEEELEQTLGSLTLEELETQLAG